ncbi:MAG TPA: RIP metalloprotease RseP [Gammaproteobacteria bacterium]|jgi:regulator of sigma E protease|nr:RIP metalloprotease RseP [Gammaproteobacteria bacterium]
MSSILISLISIIILLGVIIGFHELGHFLAARKFNVHVIRFKIGFGKTLVSRFDKRGTEFSIGLLPLGGYVQMLGEDNPIQGKDSDPGNYSEEISYPQASLGARAIITAAGPIANFVLAVIAYFLIFMIGVKDLVPIVGAVNDDSLAMQAGIEVGDRIISIDNKEVVSLKDLNTLLALRIGETGSILVNYKKPNSDLKYSESVNIENWLSSELDQSIISSFGILPFIPPIVSSVQVGSPADKSGIESGDQIIRVGDNVIRTWYELVEEISSIPDKETSLTIKRNGTSFSVPASIGSVQDELGIKIGRIGIARISSNEEIPDEFLVITKKGPIESFALGIKETYNFTVLILDSIGKMITGSISAENIGGPIQIAVLSGSAAKAGLVSFISMIALLSINLGLVNLLPVPILDGGQLVLIAAEKIKGSPLSPGFIEFAYRIGLLLVIGLMAFAVFNDITRIV